MEAYRAGPHVKFLNSKSDDGLLTFIDTWGPLSIPDGSPEGESILSVRSYRLFQRKLEVLVGLLHSFRKGRGEKLVLLEFLLAEDEMARALNTPSSAIFLLVMELRQSIHSAFRQLAAKLTASKGDEVSMLRDWITLAPTAEVRLVIAVLIDVLPLVSVRMRANPRSRRVSMAWDMDTLEDALLWMVCQDALDERLPQTCPECKTTFRPAFHHRKKFCSTICAQRCAAREWARRSRKHQRQGRLKLKKGEDKT
jgi:hypothetical protein